MKHRSNNKLSKCRFSFFPLSSFNFFRKNKSSPHNQDNIINIKTHNTDTNNNNNINANLSKQTNKTVLAIQKKIEDFSYTRVGDIMIQRTNIIALDVESNLKQIVDKFNDTQKTRLPVYEDSLDKVIGLIHIKDIISYATNDKKISENPQPLKNIIRDIIFTVASMKITTLLERMKTNSTHMAIVLDEYGGTDGIVTLEDIVEELFGEIQDEHDDKEEVNYTKITEDSYNIDPRLTIEAAEHIVHRQLCNNDLKTEIDTLGGLVVHLAGKIPKTGEHISDRKTQVSYKIIESDDKVINKMVLQKNGID